MNILIYVGYQSVDFNPETVKTIGLGGTEIACIKLAERLPMYGHKVVVSGDVEPGVFNDVEWIKTADLHARYHNQFDVIIGASYIHFALEFESYTRAKKVFWVHNTDYHAWFNGELIDNHLNLLKSDKIDYTICLTGWHALNWFKTYSIQKLGVVGNGIDLNDFHGRPKKVKNSFIWSSAPERGLGELLENWPRIKEIMPDATLEVFTPSYALSQLYYYTEETDLLKQSGITIHGNVGQDVLHEAMLKAEYWPYLTSYEETYCITALEMQYAGVMPITTNKAALAETVNSGIIVDDNETKWDLALELLRQMGSELRDKAVVECVNWAKQQTWDERASTWHNIIKSICK
jgi:hypothetical protein